MHSFTLAKESGDFERAPFDAASVVLMATGMVALLYGLSSFTTSDNLLLVAAMIVAGAALLALFVHRQLCLEAPILRVQVLKTRQFRIMIVLVSLLQAAFVGGDVVKHLARQSALVPSGINLFHVAEDAGFLERFDALMKTRALDIASRNVLVVEADSDPEDAFKLLAERRIKKLPVVRDGKLVGAISRRNIIGVLDDIALQRNAE